MHFLPCGTRSSGAPLKRSASVCPSVPACHHLSLTRAATTANGLLPRALEDLREACVALDQSAGRERRRCDDSSTACSGGSFASLRSRSSSSAPTAGSKWRAAARHADRSFNSHCGPSVRRSGGGGPIRLARGQRSEKVTGAPRSGMRLRHRKGARRRRLTGPGGITAH
ncbi:hypothetical protein AAVH_26118 [Aphelenchoides avenae]|nr:hypothetical protein AAVH_26118 [Aphelenchus avenae]